MVTSRVGYWRHHSGGTGARCRWAGIERSCLSVQCFGISVTFHETVTVMSVRNKGESICHFFSWTLNKHWIYFQLWNYLTTLEMFVKSCKNEVKTFEICLYGKDIGLSVWKNRRTYNPEAICYNFTGMECHLLVLHCMATSSKKTNKK